MSVHQHSYKHFPYIMASLILHEIVLSILLTSVVEASFIMWLNYYDIHSMDNLSCMFETLRDGRSSLSRCILSNRTRELYTGLKETCGEHSDLLFAFPLASISNSLKYYHLQIKHSIATGGCVPDCLLKSTV